MSRLFHTCCNTSGITLRRVGTEVHNSLNVGVQLNGPLRDTFLKMKESHPDLDDATRLAHCVYAANAHYGPDGFFPLAIVFGVQPKLPVRQDISHTLTGLEQVSGLARSMQESSPGDALPKGCLQKLLSYMTSLLVNMFTSTERKVDGLAHTSAWEQTGRQQL